jgi:thiosulfate/3-mercaptopyruvate sulfurtransferase
LLFAHDGTFCSPKDLRRAFAEAGVDLDKPVVTTCGGGVTAAVLLFGLHVRGKDDVALYDGSWSEWGADPDTPKELGAAA